MVGKGLKDLCKEYPLKSSNGVVYGVISGYMCTFSEGAGFKTLAVSGFISDEAASRLNSSLDRKQLLKQYRINDISVIREGITFVFTDTVGTLKLIKAFLGEMPVMLSSVGVLGDGVCTSCGQPISDLSDTNVLLIDGVAHRVHKSCSEGLLLRSQSEQAVYKEEDKKLGLGILGAALGGIVGAIPWAVAYYFNWFFAVIGVLIGFCAKKGYEILGGKVCKAKTVVICVVTVLSACLGQFLGEAMTLASLIKEGELAISYADIPYSIIYLLSNNSEYLSIVVKNLGLGIMFALLGVWGILRASQKEHKDATLNAIVLE